MHSVADSDSTGFDALVCCLLSWLHRRQPPGEPQRARDEPAISRMQGRLRRTKRASRLAAAAATRFSAAMDFPAFLCRIRGFPAMLWPVQRVANSRVRAYRAFCRNAGSEFSGAATRSLMYSRCMSTMLARPKRFAVTGPRRRGIRHCRPVTSLSVTNTRVERTC